MTPEEIRAIVREEVEAYLRRPLTLDEAADELGLSADALRFRIRRQAIPVERNGRRILLRRRVVDDIAAGRYNAGTKPSKMASAVREHPEARTQEG